MHFARLLVDRGKPDEALALSDQSLKIWIATSSPSSPPTAQAHAIHAYALAHLGRPREAAEELEAAMPVLIKSKGADDPVGAPRAELAQGRASQNSADGEYRLLAILVLRGAPLKHNATFPRKRPAKDRDSQPPRKIL